MEGENMAYTYSDFLKKAQATNTLKDFDPDELRLAEPYPEYGIAAASLKAEANSATTSAQRAIANEAAAQLKASYNGFTGSYQDEIDDILDQLDKYPDFSYDQEAPEYDNKYEEEQDAILDQIGKYPDFSWDQEAPTYTNPYEQLQKELLDQLLNRDDFTWSTDTDPVFGEYQKQYLREGERATANALAQAAAASGGQTSSYAATAASQAGNYYASQLSDMIPELYNQAYQRYLSEYEQLANDLGVVNTQQQLDYKEYLDRLGQYNTDKNFAYQQYLDDYNKLLSYLDAVNGQEQMDYQEYKDKLGQFNVDKEFAYQQYLDNYNQLQSYLEGLQKANDSEYQQYVDQLDWEREQQQQTYKGFFSAYTSLQKMLSAARMVGACPRSDASGQPERARHPVMSIFCKHTLSCRRPQVYEWPVKAGKAARWPGVKEVGPRTRRRQRREMAERRGSAAGAGRDAVMQKSAPRVRRRRLTLPSDYPCLLSDGAVDAEKLTSAGRRRARSRGRKRRPHP